MTAAGGMAASAVASAREAAASLLGVAADGSATPHDIQVAFRRLALVLHPDKSDSADAKAQFQLAIAARDFLLQKSGPAESAQEQAEREAAETTARRREEAEREWKALLKKEARQQRLASDMLLRLQKVWGAWQCRSCAKPCVLLRPAKHSCMCGHQLKQHGLSAEADPTAGETLVCKEPGCNCDCFRLQPPTSAQNPACATCSHSASEHRRRGCCAGSCLCDTFELASWKCPCCGCSYASHESCFNVPPPPTAPGQGQAPRETPRHPCMEEPREATPPKARAKSLLTRARIQSIGARLNREERQESASTAAAPAPAKSCWEDLEAELAAADKAHKAMGKAMGNQRLPGMSLHSAPAAARPKGYAGVPPIPLRAASPESVGSVGLAKRQHRTSRTLRTGGARQMTPRMPQSAR
eukprot:TRINITY_DN65482_c0_g1_i1.p1 TRINITY_DN65482_c0_g1~~TRINITY_DN65482_c0_g1_i1.p1  ORF type:complete len:413 (-),score=97.13 TRINITY_DN65482_c0_g1_i1:9-1247(-)